MKEQIIKNPYGFIYITTNIINGKRYIGQKKFGNKWENYLGSGIYFSRAIKKYGQENFKRDIIDIAYSEEELNLKEMEWIQDYNANISKDFYNIADGGHGGNTLKGLSEEQLLARNKKISNVLKNKTEEEINEWKNKISIKNKGKKRSDKVKKQMSERRKGFKHSEETKNKISLSNKGKEISQEQKQKIRNTLTGKYPSNKHPNFGKTGQKSKLSIPIIQLSKDGKYIKEFYGINEASRYTNIDCGDITRCCKGNMQLAGGYRWYYKTDYNNGNIKFDNIINNCKKAVVQLSKDGEYIAEFNSISEIEKCLGLKKSGISSCCKGRYKTSGGFKWMYKINYEKSK